MIYARCCTGYLLRSRNIFIIKLHKCISNNVKSFYISSIRKRRCDQWSVAPTVFVFDQRKKKRESNALTTKFTIQECHDHAMHAPVYVCVSTVIQADTILMFAVVTGLSHKLNLRSLFAPATDEEEITNLFARNNKVVPVQTANDTVIGWHLMVHCVRHSHTVTATGSTAFALCAFSVGGYGNEGKRKLICILRRLLIRNRRIKYSAWFIQCLDNYSRYVP